jgi:hypothetical protein
LSAYRELAGNCLVQPYEHARHRLLCLHVQAGRKASRALELGDMPQEQAAGRQADWRWLSIRGCRPVCRARGADRTSSWTSERGTAAFVAKAASTARQRYWFFEASLPAAISHRRPDAVASSSVAFARLDRSADTSRPSNPAVRAMPENRPRSGATRTPATLLRSRRALRRRWPPCRLRIPSDANRVYGHLFANTDTRAADVMEASFRKGPKHGLRTNLPLDRWQSGGSEFRDIS